MGCASLIGWHDVCTSSWTEINEMTKIRILLVDDQAIPRIGLRLFLDTQPDMEVVGEAKDSRTALSKARKLQPDVIVLEIRMANDNGLQLIQQLLRECLQTRVVI